MNMLAIEIKPEQKKELNEPSKFPLNQWYVAALVIPPF